MEILECDLTFQDVLGIGTVTSHGKLLGLHLPCCRQQQKDLFTLKTGEVHKAVFPLPNILVRMHIWAAASLKLQVFFFSPFSLFLLSEAFSHTHPAEWGKYTAGSGSVCQIAGVSMEISGRFSLGQVFQVFS